VVVPRLSLYLRCLEDLSPGTERISSEGLAALAGVNPAKLRKDLSYLGSFGVRGVGYQIQHLRYQMRRELGLTREWPLVIVGAGNVGRALAHYDGFRAQGFRVVGIFDTDPAKVGTRLDYLEVEPVRGLAAAVWERGVRIGVIATPPEAAQAVAETLAGSGVTSILNFTPTVLRVPEQVHVRRVDLAAELQVLAFYLHQGEPAAG
jgi:redox-sensing transcriptional repressor